jgi:hypothetical protein
MIYIAHRGLINGPDLNLENNPEWIARVLKMGYSAEIDLRVHNGKLYLGHDEPQYEVDFEFLRENKDKLWIHTKDHVALEWMIRTGHLLNYFWHQEDDYTITSYGYIWTYPGKQLTPFSICVQPERDIHLDWANFKPKCIGICSKYVDIIKEYDK